MMKFTLDTNCLIDVAENRDRAPYVQKLLAAAQQGKAQVALVASSASEKQESGEFLLSLATFNERRVSLGFGGLELLPSIGRMDVSFFDHCLWGDDESIAREHAIYLALFPTSPPEWEDYATAKGHSADDQTGKGYMRWRNQILDAQAFWAHEHAEHDIFVTSDVRFNVLERHPAFPDAVIKEPAEAAGILQEIVK